MHRPDSEDPKQFEGRKQDHIKLSLDPKTEASDLRDLEAIDLIHEALPEINFNQINISQNTLGQTVPAPLFISSMTAGHTESVNINEVLAMACEQKGWIMGVGSQRRELTDINAASEWKSIRKKAPNTRFIGNIGLSQLIISNMSEIQKLVDNLGAIAIFVHTNPLQECFQPEGTPEFSGGLKAIEKLVHKISVPVIIKEVGCGFSHTTLKALCNTGIAAVDVSGRGGTHWGRIEGFRSQEGEKLFAAAHTFKNWGISTVETLLNGVSINPAYELWASGGVRSGLDAAKLLAIGAQMVGFARPLLEAAVLGTDAVIKKMELLEFELRVAMMCTGSKNLNELKEKQVWKKHQK